MAEQPLLTVENLSVEFHARGRIVQAVRNVSWQVNRGETLAILGESGSGKSVSSSAVMGLIDSPPGHITSGKALFEGRDLLALTRDERREINGRRIAMIFQDPLAHLNPVYPVGWQVAEAMRVHGVPPSEARARAVALLERVGIPHAADRMTAYPHEFSGGQRQRIMIAMAVAMKPDLLIADEPTTALDVTVQAQILNLLSELRDETGMGLVLITHDLGVVAQHADRMVVMKDGEVVESGRVADVFRAPAHDYTRRLLGAAPGKLPFRVPDETAEPLLEVQGLVKAFHLRGRLFGPAPREVRALDGVSFALRKGETLGIVGESGSGKTTLARVLLRLMEPTSGSVRYRGQDVFAMSKEQVFAFRRRVQVVFQDPTASLNPRMTVEEIIGEHWAIHPEALPTEGRRAGVEKLLLQVGLDPAHASRHPHQFSGGQRQRIAIARALSLKPEIILCDEAVSALDVSVQAQVIELLKDIQKQYGLSYIFIAHDLPVVRDFADRVLVMHRGQIVEQGPTGRVFSAPQADYTRSLLAASPDANPMERPERRAGGQP
ncbi:ABC transporter ATP-binding protein [Paracoccaceae bacterium]